MASIILSELGLGCFRTMYPVIWVVIILIQHLLADAPITFFAVAALLSLVYRLSVRWRLPEATKCAKEAKFELFC